MYTILEKRVLAENIYLMRIHAPRVARAAKPGQFIIVRIDEFGEQIGRASCRERVYVLV